MSEGSSTSRPDLIVVGDVMLDVSVSAGQLALGGDVHGEISVHAAGSGANAAVWAAADGARVRLFGRIGNDVVGRVLADALASRGVEAILATDPEHRTGVMLVVRHEADRSMVADRGANAGLSPEDLPRTLEAGAVLVSGYLIFHPSSEPAARAALERATSPFRAIDASSWPLIESYGRDRFLDAATGANILLANDREALALAPGGVDELASRFEYVVVKSGARGAEVLAGGRRIEERVEPDGQVVDATGAGDAFDGAFLAALACGADPGGALRRGCVAGSRAVTLVDTWPPQ